MKGLLDNKTDYVLSELSGSDFKIIGRYSSGKKFYGNITQEGLNKLIQNQNVEEVYLSGKSYPLLGESIPLINADDVHSTGYTGNGQTVCVIGTGIDYAHPDLGGCWGSGCKVKAGWDYFEEQDEPPDYTGHETLVAGIIASTNTTFPGVAPDAQLISLAVCDSEGCNNDFIGDALDYCYFTNEIYNISVVSMSLGEHGEYADNCTNPTWATDEIETLYNNGIPVVVASGNDAHTSGISYPGCAPHAISVGATYEDSYSLMTHNEPNPPCTDSDPDADEIVCLTNRDIGVLDLLAPGCSISTTSVSGGYTTNILCGTSLAAPHVSGAIAVLLEVDPTLTPDDLERILEDTGSSIGSYKRIDLDAAVDYVLDKDGDGYDSESLGGDDCDDTDEDINPGETEVCDDGVDNNCNGQQNEGCVGSCSASGYEDCIEGTWGPSQECDVSIAINRYDNENTIKTGTIDGAVRPYVIDEYKIGWKLVDGDEILYDVDDPQAGADCNISKYGTCNTGDLLSDESSMVIVSAPGTADLETLVGWDDENGYYCIVWWNPMTPYTPSNPIYVLNCYDDADCSGSNYCDKSGAWNTWDCVALKSDGQSCTLGEECSSGQCDNDAVGASDDNWCFSTYSTYFDGQENTYCEYSTGNGIASCDEKTVGTDLNICSGTSYYEEECSSTCGYQDITSVFECTESGCSCTEPLCDGLTTGDNITTCSSGQSYFADKCTSTAGGEDRGNNICRSSVFVAGCSADIECNGVEAGTGFCDSNCQYVEDISKRTYLKNDLDENISWFSPSGNIGLKGSCIVGSPCTAPTDSYTFENANSEVVAYIDYDGDFCIETGDCSDQSSSCTTSNDAVIWQNISGTNVIFIDDTGDLCLTGTLYQNQTM